MYTNTKPLIKFLKNKPSYMKCNSHRVAATSGVPLSVVEKFKSSNTYKKLKKEYMSQF